MNPPRPSIGALQTFRANLQSMSSDRWKLTSSRLCHQLARAQHDDSQDIQARVSPLGIQLLSSPIFDQLFSSRVPKTHDHHEEQKKIAQAQQHLDKHGLWGRPTSTMPDVAFRLPPLRGPTLDEHFRRIAEDQIRPYKDALDDLSGCSLPPVPSKWSYAAGWTKYPSLGSPDMDPVSVAYPDGDALVFDVEVCMKDDGKIPTLAVAASTTHWFSWCSERLVNVREKDMGRPVEMLGGDDMIPLEHPDPASRTPRVIVGHNVAFDRSYVREQYSIEPRDSLVRFVDTMSMHVAVAGFTAEQRTMYAAVAKGADPVQTSGSSDYKYGRKFPVLHWMDESTTNALKDLYSFYCGQKLTKEERNIFVEGTLEDVRDNFDMLMSYCAKDVHATQQILTHLTPQFFSRFPHPVSFAGTLEMGRCYLPVDETWPQFMENCNEAYEDLQLEQTKILKRLSAEACRFVEGDRHKEDPWLWDLDWKIGTTRFGQAKTNDLAKRVKKSNKRGDIRLFCAHSGFSEEKTDAVVALLSTPHVDDLCQLEFIPTDMVRMLCRLKGLPTGSRQVMMETLRNAEPQLPFSDSPEVEMDFKEVIAKAVSENTSIPPPKVVEEVGKQFSKATPSSLVKDVLMTQFRMVKNQNTDMIGYPEWYRAVCQRWRYESEDFSFGPVMTTRIQCVPKLLKMCWNEYPVHFIRAHGWGYLVPVDSATTPLEHNIRAVCEENARKNLLAKLSESTPEEARHAWEAVENRLSEGDNFADVWKAVKELKSTTKDLGEVLDEKIQTETKAIPPALGPIYIEALPSCKFYKIPHTTKIGQNVGNLLGKTFQSHHVDGTLFSAGQEDSQRVIQIAHTTSFWISIRERIKQQIVVRTPATDAILPRVVVSGTITRRAVEKTWLVLSNPNATRIGSELKAMVRAPPGWHFVGADVDSQELWIASLLGDAHFCGQHGCTALGWMTLQGRREDGTDMHSRTAVTAGCTRNQAKVLNYSRIYGAGTNFASMLLSEFNRNITSAEATRNATKMMMETKGRRRRENNKTWRKAISEDEFGVNKTEESPGLAEWYGGTESHMFNKLESIANSSEPKTPALGARISSAAEPGVVGENFLRSRINWVVQSSGVDYLHLLLVGMRYLFDTYDIRGRISLSIHDEVRFLVASEDRYRATLALQIVNLWTRALFAAKVGIDDLPMSVAFFSTVEIDSVLRKDVDEQAITPSNPDGLDKQYGVSPGETLNIYQVLEKTKGGQLSKNGP